MRAAPSRRPPNASSGCSSAAARNARASSGSAEPAAHEHLGEHARTRRAPPRGAARRRTRRAPASVERPDGSRPERTSGPGRNRRAAGPSTGSALGRPRRAPANCGWRGRVRRPGSSSVDFVSVRLTKSTLGAEVASPADPGSPTQPQFARTRRPPRSERAEIGAGRRERSGPRGSAERRARRGGVVRPALGHRRRHAALDARDRGALGLEVALGLGDRRLDLLGRLVVAGLDGVGELGEQLGPGAGEAGDRARRPGVDGRAARAAPSPRRARSRGRRAPRGRPGGARSRPWSPSCPRTRPRRARRAARARGR